MSSPEQPLKYDPSVAPLEIASRDAWERLIELGLVSRNCEFTWAACEDILAEHYKEEEGKDRNWYGRRFDNLRYRFLRAKDKQQVLREYETHIEKAFSHVPVSDDRITSFLDDAERVSSRYYYCTEPEAKILFQRWKQLASQCEVFSFTVNCADFGSSGLLTRFVNLVSDVKGALGCFGLPEYRDKERRLDAIANAGLQRLGGFIDPDGKIACAKGRYWHNAFGPSSLKWCQMCMGQDADVSVRDADTAIAQVEDSLRCYQHAAEFCKSDSVEKMRCLMDAGKQVACIARWYLISGRFDKAEATIKKYRRVFERKYKLPIWELLDIFGPLQTHILMQKRDYKNAVRHQDAVTQKTLNEYGDHHISAAHLGLLFFAQLRAGGTPQESLLKQAVEIHRYSAVKRSGWVNWRYILNWTAENRRCCYAIPGI